MKRIVISIFALSFTALISSNAMATVPDLIPIQGVLADTAGEPIDDLTNITFTLYDDAAGTTTLWTDILVDVDVVDGFFTVYLGSNTELDFASLITNSEVWLGIAVESDSEMERFQLAAVPFAVEAQVCQSVGTLTEADINSNFMSSTYAPDWADITGIPTDIADGDDGFTTEEDLTGLLDDNYAALIHNHDADYLSSTAPAAGIAAGDITNWNTAYAGWNAGNANWDTAFGWGNHLGLYSLLSHDHNADYAALNHDHDDRYYTETEMQGDGTAGLHWNNLASVPAGFADGVDDTIANTDELADLAAICGLDGWVKRNTADDGWQCVDPAGLFWSRTGNVGTDDTIDFLGTTDDQDVVIKRNNLEVVRITGSSRISIIMGHPDNSIGQDNSGGVIAGGGSSPDTSNPPTHHTTGYNPSTGGGPNTIDTGDIYSVISGGENNYINNDRATVGGGRLNRIHNIYGTIGGGDFNENYGDSCTIAGGWENAADGDASSVGGGRENNAGYINGSADGDYATVPGGRRNVATGDYSFAAGLNARAEHDGTFVWNDHADGATGTTLNSTAENQFMVRARGGFMFYTASGTTTGARLQAGSGSWSSLSDRASKENFAPVDGQEVLERLTSIPVQTWNYRAQSDEVRHIGPMAQDFAAAFKVGETDRMISSIDSDGVALAAIQGLYQLRKQDTRTIAELRHEVAELRELVKSLISAK